MKFFNKTICLLFLISSIILSNDDSKKPIERIFKSPERIKFNLLASVTEKSEFLGGGVEFIGKLNKYDNLLFMINLGVHIPNSNMFKIAYLSTPTNIIYRKHLNDNFMFLDFGVCIDMLFGYTGAYSFISPEFGIGLKIKDMVPFIEKLRLSYGYNTQDYPNEKYYPKNLMLKMIVTLPFEKK